MEKKKPLRLKVKSVTVRALLAQDLARNVAGGVSRVCGGATVSLIVPDQQCNG